MLDCARKSVLTCIILHGQRQWEGYGMTHVEHELKSQPECWIRAAEQAKAHDGALPEVGERVAIVGCGTSYFMAQAAAALREGSGQGETDAFAASEFPEGRAYDRVVALTRSGTTTEVLELLGRLRGRTRTTAITADPATPRSEERRVGKECRSRWAP